MRLDLLYEENSPASSAEKREIQGGAALCIVLISRVITSAFTLIETKQCRNDLLSRSLALENTGRDKESHRSLTGICLNCLHRKSCELSAGTWVALASLSVHAIPLVCAALAYLSYLTLTRVSACDEGCDTACGPEAGLRQPAASRKKGFSRQLAEDSISRLSSSHAFKNLYHRRRIEDGQVNKPNMRI